MLISKTAEYALRSVVCMAASPETKITAQQLSKKIRVPAGYLTKVMQALSRAGLISSQRGKKGGFLLTRDPGKMSIFDVTNAVDPVKRILSCPLGLHEHRTTMCPLHRRLDQAAHMVTRAFQETTIAELIR